MLLSGQRKGTLNLSFKQRDNPMAGFQIADYDPHALRRDGLEMVLLVNKNQVGKYLDDQRSTTPIGRLMERFESEVSRELDPP